MTATTAKTDAPVDKSTAPSKAPKPVEGVGVVDSWDDKKGFGFIVPESGNKKKRVFVHVSAIEGEGYKTLDRGVPVSYTAVKTERGFKATSVRALPRTRKGGVKAPPQSRISPKAG